MLWRASSCKYGCTLGEPKCCMRMHLQLDGARQTMNYKNACRQAVVNVLWKLIQICHII